MTMTITQVIGTYKNLVFQNIAPDVCKYKAASLGKFDVPEIDSH